MHHNKNVYDNKNTINRKLQNCNHHWDNYGDVNEQLKYSSRPKHITFNFIKCSMELLLFDNDGVTWNGIKYEWAVCKWPLQILQQG